MMAIIRWGLWQRRWSIAWWCLGLALFIAMIILIYPAFKDQSALNQSFSSIPQAAKSLITDTGDFFSPIGYMSSELFYILLPLLLSILTISLGSSLITQEEQDNTLELLLARPISRSKLVAGKAIVGLLTVGMVTGAVMVTTVVCAKAVTLGIGLGGLLVACLTASLLSLVFGAIAFALTGLGRSGKRVAMAVAGLVAFVSYLVSSLDGLAHWLTMPAKLLPFYYYAPASVLGGTYHWMHLLGFLVAVFVLGCIAVLGFARRDIG